MESIFVKDEIKKGKTERNKSLEGNLGNKYKESKTEPKQRDEQIEQ